MVRPVSFRMNEQTSVNNYFQKEVVTKSDINTKAQEEFDAFVSKLRKVGVEVIVIEDTNSTDTPDALFPNNWISFHENGTVGVYPMFAENRRQERREDILETIENKGFVIKDIVDYTSAEEEGIFLEGTGSLLLDRENRRAYCALSARADEDLFIEFCEDFEYTPVIFIANQTVENKRVQIYHTNVMMCLGKQFAVICLDAIDDKKEKKNVISHLKESEKEIIKITEAQMHQFAGNMLQVKGAFEKEYLVMSDAARKSLTQDQVKKIEKYSEILSSDLTTIETSGGGSARCMMSEVFLPKKV